MAANDTELELRVRARLRQLRFERRLTLAQVAEGAGMAISTVSRLESGERGLTLAHLSRLAAALGVEVDVVLEPPAADGARWQPLLDERPDATRAYRIRLPEGEHAPALGSHEGQLWLLVLSGRLRVVLGARDTVLEPGDATGFNTWTPHWFGAVAESVDLLALFAPDARAVRFRDVG
jgi:transcriptional regulator with XRE-family HTH domain